jgi:hypothetical protein
MSKILVLEDRQFYELKWLLESVYDSIQCAFDNVENVNRSVLEWHPVSERIGKGYDILIRFNNGNVAPALSDDFDYAIERGAIEWAYLPE